MLVKVHMYYNPAFNSQNHKQLTGHQTEDRATPHHFYLQSAYLKLISYLADVEVFDDAELGGGDQNLWVQRPRHLEHKKTRSTHCGTAGPG